MPTYKWEAGERIPMSAEEEAAYTSQLPSDADKSADLAKGNRSRRDALLAQTDWEVTKATEAGLAVADAIKTYRTALRDLPTHENWPNLEDADWPTAP
tara:strand:+ start:2225 stop:2518 length:294 start_codon:yes stop_codon:yes gene_type:complete